MLLRSVAQEYRSEVTQKCRSEVSIRGADQKCCSKVLSEVSIKSVDEKRCSEASVRSVAVSFRSECRLHVCAQVLLKGVTGIARCSGVSLRSVAEICVDQECRSEVSLLCVASLRRVAQKCLSEVSLRSVAQKRRSDMCVKMSLDMWLKSVAQKCRLHACVKGPLEVLLRSVAQKCCANCLSEMCRSLLRGVLK